MEDLKTSAELHASPGEVQEQLERVLASERFRKSPSLSHLLRYLVTAMVSGRSDHLKETVIGIEVFGRRSDFDCRIDNIVRVQAHRLRKSLEAYYAEEGNGDRIRFDIPKGTYIPQWRHVDEPEAVVIAPVPQRPTTVELADLNHPEPFAAEAPLALPAPMESPASPRRTFSALAVLSALLVGICGTGALLFVPAVRTAIDRVTGAPVPAADNLREAPLGDIWSPFLQPNVATIASFTNPTFLRSTSSPVFISYQGPLSAPTGANIDISPNDPNVDQDLIRKIGPRFYFSDSWTGTGEVQAVHKLTRLFARAQFDLRVVRSRSLTYNEMQRSNLIFIGSPWGNPILDKIRAVETPLVCCDNGKLLNHSPRQGELPVYQTTRETDTGELSSAYGLFSVLPGVAPGRKTAISAGLTTHGTWSTVDYVTSEAGAAEIARRLRQETGGRMPEYFQAVVRTAIINGEPSQTTLVLARPVNANSADKK